ncbi:putative DNA end protector protein [Pelagibacter phage Mosig EXVC030M]|jgi:hypothetical protein|nr:putative DNA end protector protein [Pelagibacter phage Mosig EXVC030M]|tara:strand:+ start:408 stop:965 length:558 start_codon:yes stop_codon:yes gene_type:complete
MAIDIFEPLKDLQGNKQKGANWYRNAVSLIADRTSPSELFASGKLLGRPSAGRMSMFFYDPKTKARLPYYDTFPLVLPIEPAKGGFIGLNFHYLPYGARFAFLQQLQSYASNAKFDQSTKIQASYNSIKNNKYTKASIKRYLYSHVRSNFLRVDVNEMALAAYLPVAQFQGATIGSVFAKSRKTF